MQINGRLHIINNTGPVMQPCLAEVSRLSVRQLDFHTQPGGGRATRSLGGEGGSERAGQRGLVLQPFVHSSSLCL